MYLRISLVLVGLFSTISQTILIKELGGVFGGNEFALGIAFTTWLFWIALGTWFSARKSFFSPLKNFIILGLIATLLLPAELFFIRSLKSILGIAPGGVISFSLMLPSIFLILAPLGLILGAQYYLASQSYISVIKVSAPQGISREYIYDTIGDFLGGIFFAYLLVKLFNSFQIIFLISSVVLVFILFLNLIYFKNKLLLFLTSFFFIFTICGLRYNEQINNYSLCHPWEDFEVKAVKQSEYNNYLLLYNQGVYSLYSGGNFLFSFPDILSNEELVHFSLLQTLMPWRVMIIENACSGALTEILKYSSIKEVLYLQLDSTVIELVEDFLPSKDQQALKDPRVKIINQDAYHFVKNYKGEKFDAVIINTGDAENILINRFYTKEFFGYVKQILDQFGIISFSIESNPLYLNKEQIFYNGSIYKTLETVFPYIILFPGTNLQFVACADDAYLYQDVDILCRRIKANNIQNFYLNSENIPFLVIPNQIEYIENILKNNWEKVKINSIFNPISYYYNGILQEGKFSSTSSSIFEKIYSLEWDKIWIVFLICILIGGFFLKKKKSLPPLIVFVLGLISMGVGFIIIIGFEVLYGYVYNWVGLITAMCMVGIAVGTLIMESKRGSLKRPEVFLRFLMLINALYLIGLPFLFNAFAQGSFENLFFILTNFLNGIFVGLNFSLATHLYFENKRKNTIAGILYGMDMAGAALGALLVSLILIPLYGILSTCFMLAGLSIILEVILFLGET